MIAGLKWLWRSIWGKSCPAGRLKGIGLAVIRAGKEWLYAAELEKGEPRRKGRGGRRGRLRSIRRALGKIAEILTL